VCGLGRESDGDGRAREKVGEVGERKWGGVKGARGGENVAERIFADRRLGVAEGTLVKVGCIATTPDAPEQRPQPPVPLYKPMHAQAMESFLTSDTVSAVPPSVKPDPATTGPPAAAADVKPEPDTATVGPLDPPAAVKPEPGTTAAGVVGPGSSPVGPVATKDSSGRSASPPGHARTVESAAPGHVGEEQDAAGPQTAAGLLQALDAGLSAAGAGGDDEFVRSKGAGGRGDDELMRAEDAEAGVGDEPVRSEDAGARGDEEPVRREGSAARGDEEPVRSEGAGGGGGDELVRGEDAAESCEQRPDLGADVSAGVTHVDGRGGLSYKRVAGVDSGWQEGQMAAKRIKVERQ
jgi:hypothetical protein